MLEEIVEFDEERFNSLYKEKGRMPTIDEYNGNEYHLSEWRYKEAIEERYPWLGFKVPKNFWSKKENVRRAVDWLKEVSGEEKLVSLAFSKYHLSSLMNIYRGSVFNLMKKYFEGEKFYPWLHMKRVPINYWNEETVPEAVDWLYNIIKDDDKAYYSPSLFKEHSMQGIVEKYRSIHAIVGMACDRKKTIGYALKIKRIDKPFWENKGRRMMALSFLKEAKGEERFSKNLFKRCHLMSLFNYLMEKNGNSISKVIFKLNKGQFSKL